MVAVQQVHTPTADVAAGRRTRTARPLPAPLAIVCALAAGAALVAAFPPVDAWWAAPFGVALLAVAAHRRRWWAGAGLGMLTGLAFFVPLLAWTNLHTGVLPWLLLSVAEAAYVALLGAASAWTSVLVERFRWAWPLLAGALWVAQEAVRDRTPFGGFPWGRLAFSQGDSPLLRYASLGGAPAVSFAVAACGGALAVALLALWSSRRWRDQVYAGAAVVVGLALIGMALLVPIGRSAGAPVTVALVQGNVPRLGLDFNAQREAVLDNHVNATLDLATAAADGRMPKPDLVVWPENASDVDPLDNADARERIDLAARAVGAPILLGAILPGPGPAHVRNVSILWTPRGGPDLRQIYVKRHPVPFAEYVPLRRLARMVSDKVDLVRSDFVAGAAPGVIHTTAGTLGDLICFEVAYDNLVRDTVTGGGQLLVVQTNNATFNEAEARQQLAMVRLRAVEHGRDAMMVSTVGISAFVDTGGSVSHPTRFNTAAVVDSTVHLDSARTLATRLGAGPEVGMSAAAVAALASAGWISRRRRGSGEGEDDEGAESE